LELLIPITLVLIGLLLIVVEVYLIPGFNVVGILGIVLIVFAIGYSFTESGIVGGSVALVGSGAALGGMFWLLWQTGAWNRFVLSTDLHEDAQTAARDSEHRASYLGRTGRAITPLRPTGVAEIDGERIEVVTEGEFIASGSAIRVVAMDRRRYFVRLAGSMAEPSASI
jgi:membrane-bound serine protease (ClpP class)